MKYKKYIYLLCLLILSVNISTIASAEDWKYNYLEAGETISSGGNYSINVNYSEYSGDAHLFDGYSSSGLYSYYKSLFDLIYAPISSLANYLPLTGGTLTGNITANHFIGNGSLLTGIESGGSVSLGTDGQIPFTNSAEDDFDYSSGLSYDGTDLKLKADNSKLYMGAGDDLEMYYSGSAGYLNTVGKLYINGLRTDMNYNDNIRLGDDRTMSKMSSTTALKNIAIGSSAGRYLTSGDYNVFIGTSAGNKITTTGSNMFIGNAAGSRITTGGSCMAIGANSLQGDSNPLVTQSVAIGNSAMRQGSSYSVAIGESAGYSCTGTGTVCIGRYAGYHQQNGNIAIGSAALYGSSGSTGTTNVAVGSYSGYYITSGSGNIFLGNRAGQRQTTNSNLLIIDNQIRTDATEEETNSILYGTMGTTPDLQSLKINADLYLQADNRKLYMGAGDDVSETFTGTTRISNAEVGSPEYNWTNYGGYNFDNDVKVDGALDVTGNISSGNGFSGDCVNTTFLNGIATGCND
jgi:hypothetical protein